MNILMVSGEANPFAKSGGLADVVYSLSKAIVDKGQDEVSVIMPFYKKIKDEYEHKAKLITTFPVYMSWRVQYCGVFYLEYQNIKFYFIDNEQYFYRDGLYGFDDDIERFAYFDIAVVEFILNQKLKFDIIHLHDWQAGMIPLLLKTDYRTAIKYYVPHFVLTIHNPAFQGLFDPYYLGDYFNLSQVFYDNGTVRFNSCASFLKAAIVLCDKITTVSKNHASELLNGQHAYGLENVLVYRKDDFLGIVNGVDEVEFNPNTDSKIAYKYSLNNASEMKKKNKEILLKKYGIKNPELPLFAVVSRLTSQKGINLILDSIENLKDKANIFILGSGEKDLENRAQYLRDCYPDNVAIYIGYNDSLAHEVYASCDFFMMPSKYEPCGIGQMIAHRYGAIPIVRRTGGLIDTVNGYDGTNLEFADGFDFNDLTLEGFSGPINSSLYFFKDRKVMNRLIQNAMKRDHSWDTSCNLYLSLYKDIIGQNN